MAIFGKQFDYVMSCQKKKKQMCFGLQPKLTSEVKEKKRIFRNGNVEQYDFFRG